MIDKKSPVPIYHQLENLIKQQIDKKMLKEDTAIPSEREIAEKYKISRMTVRQALNNLVNEEILYRRKGIGTFVNTRKVVKGLFGMTGFTEDMIALGMTPHNEILALEKTAAPLYVAEQLNIFEHDKVWKIERARSADHIPMGYEISYMPCSIIRKISKDQLEHSIYEFIQYQLGLTLKSANQQIEATKASKKEALLLGIELGDPVLHLTRTSFLDDGTAFEYVKSSFRADRYKFTHQMTR